MKEQDGFAVRTDLGLTVAKDARAFADQAVAGDDDIVNLVANMMNSAVGVALQKLGDG